MSNMWKYLSNIGILILLLYNAFMIYNLLGGPTHVGRYIYIIPGAITIYVLIFKSILRSYPESTPDKSHLIVLVANALPSFSAILVVLLVIINQAGSLIAVYKSEALMVVARDGLLAPIVNMYYGYTLVPK